MTIPYTKPSKTFSEQVALVSGRGLDVGDPKKAEETLARVGYYRLSGYWHPFKQADDRFEAGASLEKALQLYEFDRKLRLLVLDALERVEIGLRTSVTYALGNDLGAFAHENAKSFRMYFGGKPDHEGNHRVTHAEWLAGLYKEARRSTETFIGSFKQKYEGFPSLPIWMATEVMSLGSLSKLYQAMKKPQQQKVATSMHVHFGVARSWFQSLSYVRNICAHHSRLWNRELSIHPQVPRGDTNYSSGDYTHHRRVYLVLLMLRQLTNNHHAGDDWARAMVGLLGAWDGEPRWQNAMGMPVDWRKHSFWEGI